MMVKTIREDTLSTLGLGTVLEIFEKGALPVKVEELVDKVFGPAPNRGSLVISGASGIVGAGKAMQLGSRLFSYGVPLVALDLPGAPDGLGKQYSGLVRAFGRDQAGNIMDNILRLTYDGSSLPSSLKKTNPRFLLEAIPEILELKKAHYEMFRKDFPEIEIRSVTSGFPRAQLGVGVAHPAFPHEINKIWEVVEPSPSAITQLLWSLGLIPLPVGDHWSFVLDVLFCGLTLAGTRYHRATNMPYWKVDKFIRRDLGPNPFRAHDAIGAKGANFLTWSCLHHLSKVYGGLFTPTPELEEHKDSGQDWYPLNHFRPLVNWDMNDREPFEAWVYGPLVQMGCLMVSEERAHYSLLNALGELCAQFRGGIMALLRSLGKEKSLQVVESYHKVQPEAKDHWHPEVLDKMAEARWQHLYVNGQHNGEVGVITISRESYNSDVDAELNRTIDWLKAEGIKKVILTGDFHLSTQMVGADTSEFFPALETRDRGYDIAFNWSKTARRLYKEFEVSVGFIAGKRCLGGMLELLSHCHFVIANDDVRLGMPEVTLPVVPGMEGCHWPLRKAGSDHWPQFMKLLLRGKAIKAKEGEGWLVDYVGPMEAALAKAWKIVTGGDHGLTLRKVQEGPLEGIPQDMGELADSGDPMTDEARRAIFKTLQEACKATLEEALSIQANHSADFMQSKACKKGFLGTTYQKTMVV